MTSEEYWAAQEELCFQIAEEAHKGQKYGDKPYFEAHVLPVANRVAGDPSLDSVHVCVALLHDVLEDTALNVADLAARGVDPNVIVGTIAITKPKEADYFKFLRSMVNSPVAFHVKYHDMAQNYSVGRREKYLTGLRNWFSIYKH